MRKPIKDYEKLYEIDENGVVYSLAKQHGFMFKKEFIKKQKLDKDGYSIVKLCKDAKLKDKKVHRLVAEAFVSNTDNKSQVNHIDGVRDNNHYSNLEWCTNSENQIHSWKHNGRVPSDKQKEHARQVMKYIHDNGLRADNSRKVLQYDLNGNFIAEYKSIAEACRSGNFTGGNITMCCQGKYKHHHNYIWRYKVGDAK